MTASTPLPPLVQKAALLGLGVAAIYAALIPLGPGSGRVPPDLLFCLVAAWAVRAPRTLPLGLVVALGLAADVMLSRPIGLGALGLVLGAEAMRARAGLLHSLPFVVEWLAAVAVFAATLAGIGLVLRLALAPAPGLGASLAYLAATAVAYPVVVAGLAWGLKLRRPRGSGGQPSGRPT